MNSDKVQLVLLSWHWTNYCQTSKDFSWVLYLIRNTRGEPQTFPYMENTCLGGVHTNNPAALVWHLRSRYVIQKKSVASQLKEKGTIAFFLWLQYIIVEWKGSYRGAMVRPVSYSSHMISNRADTVLQTIVKVHILSVLGCSLYWSTTLASHTATISSSY